MERNLRVDHMYGDLEQVLYHESTIFARLDELAREITRHYRDVGGDLVVLAILDGGLIFMADLMRRVNLPLQFRTLSVSSYHGGTESSGVVKFMGDLPEVKGKHVLLMDDILDSGRTLAAVKKRVHDECDPVSVQICVLLQKKKQRAEEVKANYVAFEIDDEFVVGYGLDYQGCYRNLPVIGILKSELIQPEHR
ncbi:MAG: hypoxanthine phosphoribosyltransferase [Verrucomicrobia bacterium]|nr:hypoxanthine phosphoribosyltransferase [Verrucomicrobiota bacterium]